MSEWWSLLVSTILNIVLPWAFTSWDQKRLRAPMNERVWNGPSRACAIVFFGPLCLPVHFWRTRRSLGGLVMGLLLLAVVVGVELCIDSVL